MSEGARARQRIVVPRIPVRFLSETMEGIGQLKNTSRAGVFVASTQMPRPGAVVALQFRAPNGLTVDLRGEVRWTTQGLPNPDLTPGFGVLLHEPPREYREFFLWALAQAKDES